MFSALVDILSTLGEYLDLRGEYHDPGFHCNGDIMSTLEGGRGVSALGDIISPLEDIRIVVDHPQCTDDIPQ